MTHSNPSNYPTRPTWSTTPAAAVSGGAQGAASDASSSRLTPSAAEPRLHAAAAASTSALSNPTTGTRPDPSTAPHMQDTAAGTGADIFACLATRNMNIATASWTAPPPATAEMALSEKSKLTKPTQNQRVFFSRRVERLKLTTGATNGAEQQQCTQRGHHLLLCVFQALAERLNIRSQKWSPLSVAVPVPTRKEVDKVVDQLVSLRRHITFDAKASAVQGTSAAQGASAAESHTSLQAARRRLARMMAARPASMRVRLARTPFTPTAAEELADVDEADIVEMISTAPAPPPASALTPSRLRLDNNDTAGNLADTVAEVAIGGASSANLAETSVASAPVPLTPVLKATPNDALFDGARGAEEDESDFLCPDDTPDDNDDASESKGACGLGEVQPDPAQGDDRQERNAADKAPTTSAGRSKTTAGAGKQIESIFVSDDDDDDEMHDERRDTDSSSEDEKEVHDENKDMDSSSEDEEEEPLQLVCQPRHTASS